MGVVNMTIFVSHSFENKDEFENIVDALTLAGVPYWNPIDIKSGDSLRDQLRDAVGKCGVCIFIATHRSVRSSWCGAELGAFWGAGTPIIVYRADSSLTEDALPPIVQGDVWEGKISRVAARAKELFTGADGDFDASAAPRLARVASMTVEQLERLITGAVSLVNATEKKDDGRSTTPREFEHAARDATGRILRGIDVTTRLNKKPSEEWQKQILWVDDRLDNNTHERRAFESMGLEFTLALSTHEALEILSKRRFAAIISDMGRREGPREGYVLLKALRAQDNATPFFIYAGSRSPEHRREGAQLGAQGVTNAANELFDMVIKALPEEISR